MGWFSSAPNLESLAPVLNPEDRKKLAKVLVIDDEEQSFPIENLRADGYSIEHWESVDGPRLSRLEDAQFDIVILDIQGVAAPGLSGAGDGLAMSVSGGEQIGLGVRTVNDRSSSQPA